IGFRDPLHGAPPFGGAMRPSHGGLWPARCRWRSEYCIQNADSCQSKGDETGGSRLPLPSLRPRDPRGGGHGLHEPQRERARCARARLPLRLEERRDVEGMVRDLENPRLSAISESRELQAALLEDLVVLRIQLEVAVVLLFDVVRPDDLAGPGVFSEMDPKRRAGEKRAPGGAAGRGAGNARDELLLGDGRVV